MTQNQLIAILIGILALVLVASGVILWSASGPQEPAGVSPEDQASSAHQNQFPLEIVRQQAYQLLNKQLVKEGALPVQPATNAGKANPFL